MTQDMNHTFVKALRAVLVAAMMLLSGGTVMAQSTGVVVNGNVYGGGNEADVMVNTEVNIETGRVEGNVYGGGNLGDVGNIDKTDKANYSWTGTDGNANSSTGTKNTGVCTVNITGGLIGLENVTADKDHGNVFGGGKGDDNSLFYCEKGMVYSTNVEISAGTVKGTVFGGGEVGRVEDNTIVTIGVAGASGNTSTPVVNGDVFGAGKGLKTHGYSALVRGNPVVTIQGKTLVGRSVYGGGEIASVGKHKVKTADGNPPTPSDAPADLPVGMPYTLANTNLGKCTVTIKDNVTITNNVFGAGQGVEDYTYDENFKRMGMNGWDEPFADAAAYHVFLQTLALATDTHVTIEGNANVNGSVFGGSESGFVQYDTNVTIKGGVIGVDVYGGGRGMTENIIAGRVNGNTNVHILGGTITRNVYGGAALAKSNAKSTSTTSEGENPTTTTTYPTATVNLLGGSIGGDAYGGGLGDANTAADVGNTKVNLNGLEVGDYDATIHSNYVQAVPATGTADHYVLKTTTSGTGDNIVTSYTKGATMDHIFGANNTNGSPKGSVTVHVFSTQHKDLGTIQAKYNPPYYDPKQGDNEGYKAYLQRLINVAKPSGTVLTGIAESVVTTAETILSGLESTTEANLSNDQKTSITTATNNINQAINGLYDVLAVYGGGNNANYTPDANISDADKTTNVIIEGCDFSSIQNVYGGGNAAAAPATDVLILGTKIIDQVFGGGNGEAGPSSAAHVGFYRTASGKTEYATGTGTGATYVKLVAGTINNVYGGSNSNGDIRGGANTIMPSKDGYTAYNCCDNLITQNVYGGGKNADMSSGTSVVLGCMPDDWIDEIYAGSREADVAGDVSLTITSGKFERVFGGNKTSGKIKGSITVNIEETTSCATPIVIGELYGGGNLADYSIYGYKNTGTESAPVWEPRVNASDAGTGPSTPYDNPQLNVRSFTSIGAIYGGGYSAKMVANPTVNINVVKGSRANDATLHSGTNDTYPAVSTPTTPTLGLPYPVHKKGEIGVIGNVFGGGNLATVYGSTTVNIGTESTLDFITEPSYLGIKGTGDATLETTGIAYIVNADGTYKTKVEGANITGDVFGGGNQADVTGNTFVNICAKKGTGDSYTSVAFTTDQVTIGGNVFGGGKGVGDSFTCEKAMVGIDGAGADKVNYPNGYPDGNTNIVIGNGTVTGNVYGGGEVGRVEMNTSVTIGLGAGVASGETVTSAPEIQHSVFGGGKGLETHGYSALVRGNPTVIIQGNAKVRDNVYGGGQIASVARYKVAADDDEGAPYGVKKDMPYALLDPDHPSGICTVTVQGYAEIGPATIDSEAETTLVGHVFGAGKGIVPGPGGDYAFVSGTTKRMVLNADKTASIWETFADEAAYITFIKTLALASQTYVTIDGNAKVKGSVFGGSESGFVQFDTNVNVTGGTIGTQDKGGADFGNVYGGGKGDAVHIGVNVTYVDAGLVKGDTKVKIEGGTILHNIYGGGAYGTVGEFVYNTSGMPTGRRKYIINQVETETTGGNTEVYVIGGTIGTNGSENGMIFGSSRGDVGASGSIHDKLAWVYDTHVAIGDTIATTTATTTPLIKGSVYGGGENGHNFHSSFVRINGGTIGITEGEPIGTYTAGGASYPYRGNVYGGGCGTDMYDSNNDGVKDAYNPLSGIVRGDATIRMTAGHVVHNMYGAGAMGSVGKMNTTGAITSGGTTTIEISGGTMGVDGTVDDGNVFGAARGDETAPKGLAQVKTTNVTISGTATGTIIKGNVYGGGALGDVGTYTYNNTTKAYTWDKVNNVETGDCHVTVNGGTIAGYVYGAGKGIANTFECEKALVRTTNVSINAGTVNHNVYGGGEIGRVDQNTKVTIGSGGTDGTGAGTSEGEDAIIGGEVFGAGKGLETHGYSALVRGNAEVIAQGNATVGGSVYGGGEIAAVGRYRLDENEMPTALVSGGECKVTVKGYAVVGQSGTGNVFGAGKGVDPSDATHTYIDFTSTDKDDLPKRMTLTPSTLPTVYDNVGDGSTYIWEYYTSQASYFKFLQTLALATDTKVSIEGNATVNGNVYGGSESGFVQRDTEVEIKGGAIGTTGTTTDGNIFGGGKGLDVFAEAGRVRGNATVAISGGNIADNVYGGGELGHVGSFTETTDGRFVMQKIKDKDNNDMDTGLCTITITGGKVGSDTNTDSNKGNVFGAGKGKDDTFKCEKAMVMNTSVSINTGAVNGDVFGGGEIGRVEYNSRVTMGSGSVKRSIFGGGAGAETHGYSALVRGNTTVTIQGGSVGESVYGGGEIASVGRYGLDAQKMPSILLGGGYCYVTVKGSATIGSATEAGDVFGAGKGVDPSDATHTYIDFTSTDKTTLPKRMTVYNADDFPESAKISTTGTATAYEGSIWEYFDESVTPKLVWEYFQDETKYNNYLETLALATHPEVNIDGEAHVYGSVFGGGELGITKGSVFVNILGGTIEEDVYGGGSLANTNTTSSIGKTDPDTGAAITDSDGNIELDEDIHPTTTVNLLGGHIKGDAYGGGLGQLNLPTSGTQPAVPAIEAKVFGNVKVNLNGLQSVNDMNATTVSSLTSLEDGDTGYKRVKSTTKGAIVKRIFGCNNLNGSPQKKVQVYIFGTQSATNGVTQIANAGTVTNAKVKGRYDVAAVYGGGNLSPYVPADALLPYTDENKATVDAARTEVYIDGCDRTSIQQVYGGGNAASAPATFVQVNRCFEINEVFGGGNGFDDFSLVERGQEVFYKNSGANVGYYTGYYNNYATYSNYTTRTSGGGSGTQSEPWEVVEDSRYTGGTDNKDTRLAAKDIQYGSGIARLEVKGGTVNTSYGGSNSKGNVRALLSSVYSAAFDECPMSVGTSYGGGKNAYSDADSDMQADCAKGVKTMFGGSENADFDGNINMRITNGSSLEKVFGGNNTSGAVNGSITITIEEGGCEPIRIGELYLGGFLAPYSVYGYAKNENGSYKTEMVDYIDGDEVKQKEQRIPLKKGDEGALSENDRYPDPRINVISATYIGDIFGGGYQAKLVGNPHINVNMTTGFVKVTKTEKAADDTNTYPYEFSEGGKTYYYKDVAGNTYNKEKVGPDPEEPTVLIATTDVGTIGNIYGGGNMADIIGDTYVEIGTGTEHNAAGTALVPIASGRNAAKITGNVFGGGKGKADSFKCAKAMVGVEDQGFGSTNVIIGNGTIEGSVYGGGEIGRVEANTNVTIGLESGTGEPVIKGNVFGAGRGVHTHGYAALVRGNATVTVQGEAKVRKSVYGGGEIASVGKYNIADAAYYAQHPEVLEGMPYSLVSDNKGICYVTVKDNAVIGPEGSMEMKATGGPDDTGHVFGAGKGVLPYHDIDNNIITGDPWRVKPGDNEHPTGITETFNETTFSEAYYTKLYGAGYNKKLYNYLADYLRFIETLALTTQTEVTVGGNAFVKGSVYGGSENGHVQHNTNVKIQDFCQIGHSKGVSRRFSEDEWDSANPAVLKDCASWDYDANEGAPYDPLATSAGTYDYTNYQFVPAADQTSRPNSDGGKPTATDGHTFYGNVFGGGSGVIPYAPGRWHREAGSVGGNTQVDITGGHIMTSVYGGNEQTDVGTYILDPNNDYQPTIPKSGGKCTINMTGGTVGVPRSVDDMKAHPVTCYVFGAGKGDQRIFFNTWTNVIETEVNISGTARIYGSTFGGGEDGHVINNAVTNISGDKEKVIIGTTGTSYVDGNVFGGGRGFSGEAQTAGTVGGNVEVNIGGGTILGSVYGGGRLASVGTLFTAPDDPNYGNFQEDGDGKTYGHIDVEISGSAIIGNNIGNKESGNVFGGSMGRLELLDGTTINPIWPKMAQVKTSQVTVSGDAIIRRNVYGGGELGTVRDDAVVTISGGTVRRDVYGGGYGSEDFNTETIIHVKEPTVENPDPTNSAHYKTVDYKFTPMIFAGCVGKSTTVNVNGGWIRKSVYGGGEMASVGIIDCRVDADGNYLYFHEHNDAENGFVLSWPYHFEYAPGFGGAAQVNVTGGRIGVKDVPGEDNHDIASDNGDVYGAGKGIAGDYKTYIYCANVGSSEVNINLNSDGVTPENYEASGNCITGAVYGGGENGHVMGNAKLTIENGLIGHSIYGGGSGKGKFTKWLTKIPEARRTVVTNSGTGTAPNTRVNSETGETEYEAECYSITAGKVFGNTRIDMTGGYVIRNVYGGGNMASVGKGNYSGGPDDYSAVGYGETLSGNLWDGVSQFSQAFLNSGICTVNITGGKVGYIGNDPTDPLKFVYPRDYNTGLPYGNVFGGCRGESAPNILESPRYLYCPEFFLGYVNETDVTIGQSNGTGPTILGSVYGGGMDGHVRRDTKVTINSGTIGSEYTTAECNKVGTSDLNNIMWLHRGNVYGAGSGIGKYKFDLNYDGDFGDVIDYTTPSTPSRTTRLKEEDFSTSVGSVTRFTTVTINGGTIHRNVYGGGSLASVGGPKIPPISTDPIRRDEQATTTQGKQSLNQVVIAGGQIGDDSSFDADGNHVYGGNVFGASRGDATIENPSSFAQAVWTDVDIKPHATDPKKPVIYGDVYGGGEVGSVRQGVTVDLTGGKVGHDVFGGGKGTSTVAADIGGDVMVTLNGTSTTGEGGVVTYNDNAVVKGSIFGANNVNGTPKGHVTVHVYKTAPAGHSHGYDVTSVFGGGKQSDYVPDAADTEQSTEVIIEGCDLTSIQEVYGGGYGAATPGTNVLIKGTKIIENVFGGGYGAGTDDFENPGANVGYLTDGTKYGADDGGKAVVQLMAGTVNHVYGGSNTKGDIRGTSNVTSVPKGTGDVSPNCCADLNVQEIFGGGRNADMFGGTEIVLGCMPNDWVGAIYAGAENSDVGNDVSLTLTSGKFERVFGGNKSGGRLNGGIEVNIEESGTCGTPIIIGELYGGGNEAPYSIYGYKKDSNDKWIPRQKSDYDALTDAQKEAEGIKSGPNHDPVVNVRAFTSIGNIYGGGFGATAVVVGNPIVNINEVKISHTDTDPEFNGNEYDGQTITIGEGENAVNVVLHPHTDGEIGVIGNVFGGGNAAEVKGNTNVNVGTTTEEDFESLRTSDGVPKKPVVGADIRGNVYGGGNNAGVTGDTNVIIGKSK